MKHLVLAIALLAAALATSAAPAGKRRLVPLATSEAISTHAPFEMGACEACHERDPAHAPGRVLKAANALCFDCHDEFKTPVKGHPAPKGSCLDCHSPHNSKREKLLL